MGSINQKKASIISGWWFQPSCKILDGMDYPIYIYRERKREKKIKFMFQTTRPQEGFHHFSSSI
jgi:hypothetical protein